MNCYSVVCTGASQTAAPINTGRKSLLFQNQSAVSTVWVNFGRPATQDGASLAIAPQGEAAFTVPDCPTERVEVNGPAGVAFGVWEQ